MIKERNSKGRILKSYKDLKDQQFGCWKVDSLNYINKNGCAVWKCICICGCVRDIVGNLITNDKYIFKCKQCGASKRENKAVINMTGKTCGKWYVLSKGDYTKDKHILWKCRCECGNIRHIPGLSLRSGVSSGCRNCQKKDYVGEISATFYCRILAHSSKRNIYLDIDREYIWNLYLQQNRKCALSGLDIFFEKTHTEKSTASLDRIDSSKGYTKGNVQWVHVDINYMKQQFEQKYFINMCKQIAKHNENIND